MKRIIKISAALVICLAILASVMVTSVFASGTTSVAFSKSTLNVGETLTVTVRFNATEKMYGVGAFVHYDTKVLQYVSAANGSSSASGIIQIAAVASDKSTSEKIVFKAIKAGSSAIRVTDATYAADDEIPMSGSSATVKVTDKSTAKSSNANLKTLTPSAGTLTPKFSPDVTTYSVTIPNSQTKLLLNYTLADSGATDKVEGSKDMKVGANKRVIVVTAADGTVKRYTINITRQAADGTVPEPETPDTENPTDEKVSVTADGKDMYIAANFDTTNIFANFNVDVYLLNGAEYPCIKRDDTTLLYLTDTAGANGGFYRPLDDGSFTAFTYLQTKSAFYEFLKADEIPEGYSEISLDVENQKITAYQSDDPALTDFVLIWAKGPDGQAGFYRYDTAEQTIQRAVGAMYNGAPAVAEPEEEKLDGNIWENFMALDTATKIIAIAIMGIILLLIVAIIVLIVKIARPSVYEEEIEDEEEDSEFEFVSVSNRDSSDDF